MGELNEKLIHVRMYVCISTGILMLLNWKKKAGMKITSQLRGQGGDLYFFPHLLSLCLLTFYLESFLGILCILIHPFKRAFMNKIEFSCAFICLFLLFVLKKIQVLDAW